MSGDIFSHVHELDSDDCEDRVRELYSLNRPLTMTEAREYEALKEQYQRITGEPMSALQFMLESM